MTETKQTKHTENPSTAEAIAEADYNDDKAWNFNPIPSFLFKRRKDEEGEYYENIDPTWGTR